MQKWQINGRARWLCNACAKGNAHVFLLYPHKWLGEEVSATIVCDCCRCTDSMVARFGRFRWALYPFLCLPPLFWPASPRAK